MKELDGFKKCQRLAYRCALDIGRELKEGWTEQQTAKLMDSYLRDHGVRSFFHKSFAWFGDRSRFQNFTKYHHFLPSKRRLHPHDVVILDTAPILDGYVADIGYTMTLVPNPELDRAKALLKKFRQDLPQHFESDLTTSQIWKKIDQELRDAGFDNAHSKYPFSVIGHRVHKVPLSRVPGVLIPFGWQAHWSLISRGLFKELLGPKHRGKKEGLWALEPHLGGKGFGAKFEEILVVTKDGKNVKARWLDDEVPHVS